jgi:hypothetical protein
MTSSRPAVRKSNSAAATRRPISKRHVGDPTLTNSPHPNPLFLLILLPHSAAGGDWPRQQCGGPGEGAAASTSAYVRQPRVVRPATPSASRLTRSSPWVSASRSLPEAWSAAELPGVPKSASICDVGLMLRMWATSPCLVSCPHIYGGLDATPAACLLFDHAASWRWLQRQHGAGDIPIEKCRPLSSFTCSACLCLSCWLFSSKLTCAPHFVCFQSSLPPRVSWNQSDTSPNHMLTAG